ncbi:MAG: DUF5658 family protein [Archaeoglobaceae archaeon]
MNFDKKNSLIIPAALFAGLVVIDGVISYTAIESQLAYELNPLYHHLGDYFWLLKGLASLFVLSLAVRMYNQNPFLTLKAMYTCSAIMVLVVVWNVFSIVVL